MRKKIQGVFIAAVLAGFVMPAAAQVTPARIASFLEANEGIDKRMYPAKAAIYQALKSKQRAQAVASIAAQWKLPVEVAARTIDAVVDYEETRYENNREKDERSEKLFRELVTQADQSPEVWELMIGFWADRYRCEEPSLRDEYLRHSFAESHYLKFYECEEWLPAFVKVYPDNLAGRFRLVTLLGERDVMAALPVARWLLDGLAARPGAPLDDLEIAAVRKYWSLAGRRGFESLLLTDFGQRAPAEINAVLHRKAVQHLAVDGAELLGQSEAQSLQADAREQLLWALADAQRFDELRLEFDARTEPGLLADVLSGKSGDDIYARYIGDGESGLLWQAQSAGLTTKRMSARYLDANHMESAAALLRADICSNGVPVAGNAEDRRQLQGLPAAYQAQVVALASRPRTDEVPATCAGWAAGAGTVMSSNLPRYPETKLSAAEKSRPPLANYTKIVPHPKSFELVRAERAGAQIAAVFISPAVDPGGEVGRGGYWLQRSRDGGATWLGPQYLGFQQQNPYVISTDARVSMFAGELLRLEVSVEELDPESITFPPVALRQRRTAHDLYIDIPFATLARDTDGDGLTDLLEAKLQTDPANPDTDGDGLSDSLDDFPQASARASPGPLAPIVVDLLKQLTGFEKAGIIEPIRGGKSDDLLASLAGRRHATDGSMLFRFIDGDASMFAGLSVGGGQVIVLNEAQIATVRSNYGPFYPASFSLIFSDPAKTRALVKWSAGWTGGTITYRLKDGRWVGTKGAGWITRRSPAISTPRTFPG
jgi:Bacterial TSP3 repeat